MLAAGFALLALSPDDDDPLEPLVSLSPDDDDPLEPLVSLSPDDDDPLEPLVRAELAVPRETVAPATPR
jgi:hypothetical protein